MENTSATFYLVFRDNLTVTPSLFDLPLRLGDAAALAGILFDASRGVAAGSAHPKPLTDEFRARIAARAGGLSFECMTPLLASLERDPVHHSAWYVCVDGVENQPLLLRVAPASTPSSGLFPKAILIGRTFVGSQAGSQAGSQEVLLNVVPFGAGDHDRILAFSEHVNKAFQPKPFGSRPVILVSGDTPADTFPRAFEAFRRLLRSTSQNSAAFGLSENQDPVSFYFATVWSAIRAGWREGYALHSPAPVAPIPGVRRRPFETELNVSREINLTTGMSKEEIAGLFA